MELYESRIFLKKIKYAIVQDFRIFLPLYVNHKRKSDIPSFEESGKDEIVESNSQI